MYRHQSRSDDISLHRIRCQSKNIGTCIRTAYLSYQNEPDAAHNAWWNMPDPPPRSINGLAIPRRICTSLRPQDGESQETSVPRDLPSPIAILGHQDLLADACLPGSGHHQP